ncbi:MAG: (2Fe-2S)-binding protein [Tannerellaceae bacterium]
MIYIRRFSLCLLILWMVACDTVNETSIPYRPVYLELDLSFEDKALNNIQAYKLYTPKNINQSGEKTGFGGVLVYHGINNIGGSSFYAFDAACPNEASSTTIVEVDGAGINAVCPKCGSKFDLLNGLGNPQSGPAKFGLLRYNVNTIGNKIYVRN